MPGTFWHFRSEQAHAQGEAHSSKSFLALWNQPKLVLQTLGKLAIRLQALDRKLNVPGTFGHFRSDQSHAQREAQSSKSFLALWNRPKLVLQTLCKLAIRLQVLDFKLNVPGTLGHFSTDQAHAQGEAQGSKRFLALWNRPKPVLQTLGKLAIRLQALDRKVNVTGTFGHLSDQASDQAHFGIGALGSWRFVCKSKLNVPKSLVQTRRMRTLEWNRSKLVLQTQTKCTWQAGDSFVSWHFGSVRSQTKCAWNFRAL